MALADAGHRRHDLSRRTVAALEGVLLEEGGLHGVERAVFVGQPLDGGDRAALDLCCQSQAGQHPLAVDMDGAGAALALVAAFLGAGQRKPVAQRIEQRHAGFDVERTVTTIDGEMDGEGGGAGLVG